MLGYDKQRRRVSVKRAAELETSERQDKVSESSGSLAKTQQIEAKQTDSERQTEAQKQ